MEEKWRKLNFHLVSSPKENCFAAKDDTQMMRNSELRLCNLRSEHTDCFYSDWHSCCCQKIRLISTSGTAVMRRGVKLSVAESAPQSQLLLQGLSVAVQKIKGRRGRSCNQNYPTTTPAKFSSDRKVQKTLKEKTWFMTFVNFCVWHKMSWKEQV